MALEYIQIFADMEEDLALYDDAQRGRLLSAMLAYAFRGEEPNFTGEERFAWPSLRRHINACSAKIEKQRSNGARVGKKTQGESEAKPNETNESQTKPNEAKQSEAKPNEANESLQEQDQDQEHTQEQDHKRGSNRARKARFTPPTIEEAEKFFTEQGQSSLQATRFHSYYSSNGWKVGKNPMTDWRASVRNWIARDAQEGSAAARASPQNGSMLRYTPQERRETYSAAVLDFD